MLVSRIPTSFMEKQILESFEILSGEGLYPRLQGNSEKWQVDNFTNAIMLNIASHGDDLPFGESLSGWMYCGEEDPLKNLEHSITEELDINDSQWGTYARYWNGWLVILKPLLVFLNIGQIRTLFHFILLALGMNLSLQLAKLWGPIGASTISFLLAVAAFPAACMSMSLYFSIAMSLLFSIIVLSDSGSHMGVGSPCDWTLYYMIFGSLTAFFDFLCTPILTLGLPLVFALVIEERRGGVMKTMLFQVIKLSIAWFAGYGVCWVSKWLISDALGSGSVFFDALNQAALRSGTSVYEGVGDTTITISGFNAVYRNFAMCFSRSLIAALGILVAALPCHLKCTHRSINRRYFQLLLPLAIVALLPYLWYLALPNHSFVHSWFTYRAQMVTLAALLVAVWELIVTSEKREGSIK